MIATELRKPQLNLLDDRWQLSYSFDEYTLVVSYRHDATDQSDEEDIGIWVDGEKTFTVVDDDILPALQEYALDHGDELPGHYISVGDANRRLSGYIKDCVDDARFRYRALQLIVNLHVNL